MGRAGCGHQLPGQKDLTMCGILGGINTDIDRLIYPRLYSDMDRQDMAAWDKEWSQRGWESQDPGVDPGPTGDDRAPPPQSEPMWSKGSSFAEDDDADDLLF